MKKGAWWVLAGYGLLYSFAANCYLFVRHAPWLLALVIPAAVLINLLAGMFLIKTDSRRLRFCCHGGVLLWIFCGVTLVSIIWQGTLAFPLIMHNWKLFLWSVLVCVCVEAVLFWNGILCVYLTSHQLGLRLRVIGALCGMIPVVNVVILLRIIRTVFREVKSETRREAANAARKAERCCATRYPILLVHGVFFRDNRYLNYWGRIPEELKRNGAAVYYGNHQSAASVADSAGELKERILEILEETGCEKVNIIAHSKGGLDCRYAIAYLGLGPCVASLTTINTPHRGCLFADYLLRSISPEVQNKVAVTYNKALRKLGDPNPDFLAAVYDLPDEACQARDKEMGIPEGIFCRSIGSRLGRAMGGTFPLNFTYYLAKLFDGANDGLVSERSFAWGENYILLEPAGRRGISHADVIDLTRMDIEGFDVREFYVGLIGELKEMGL